MPDQFKERPPTINAVQFVGTQESADQLNNWLSSYGVFVTFDAARARVVLEESGVFSTALTGDWVIWSPGVKPLSILTSEEFDRKYEPVVEPPVIEP